MERWSWRRAVFVGGSIAAALDIAFAISFASFNGMPPQRLLQTVASGVLGQSSYEGGASIAALGLGLHFLISYLVAGVYVLAAQSAPLLRRHVFVAGSVFGIAVFLVMRLVVLPLSAFPHPVSFRPLATVLDLLSHMLLFGVPIAVAASKTLPSVAARRSPA